jgi:hypothetical protein
MELEQKQTVETVENKNEIEINEDFSDNDTQTQQEEQKEQKNNLPKKYQKSKTRKQMPSTHKSVESKSV